MSDEGWAIRVEPGPLPIARPAPNGELTIFAGYIPTLYTSRLDAERAVPRMMSAIEALCQDAAAGRVWGFTLEVERAWVWPMASWSLS